MSLPGLAKSNIHVCTVQPVRDRKKATAQLTSPNPDPENR